MEEGRLEPRWEEMPGAQACGRESKGGGPGNFSCSLLAEVLVLTAGEWVLSEPRDSG